MLKKRKNYELGRGELLNFRYWSAVVSLMEGLTYKHVEAPPTSVDAFLALFRFTTARDEENRGSGCTPLQFAAMSGNLSVMRELINEHGADNRGEDHKKTRAHDAKRPNNDVQLTFVFPCAG